MRIAPLHVAKYVPPPYAGVEGHVDTLLRALCMGSLSPTLLAAAGAIDHWHGDAQRNYRVIGARAFGTVASAIMSPGVVPLARQELETGRSNLLHIHAPNPWGDLAALTAPRGVPVVMTWHSDIVRQRKLMLLYRYVQRAVLDRVDRIVVFTPAHYASSVQLHQRDVAHKVVQVPIGIATDHLRPECADTEALARFRQFAGDRRLILTVGRHVYYKGYQYLLDALARMRESDSVLLMVGTGPLTADLKAQAAALNIAHRVHFAGEVNPGVLAAAYLACDFFCLPSVELSEAFGIASAEAMSCGKPTVVCQLGNGVNFLNQADKTSLAVPPRDVGALADALDTLVRDDALRHALGTAAQQWVQAEFSIEAMRDRTLALYQELLDARA